MFLLDTNVLAEPTRPRPDPQLGKRLQEHEQHLHTATIVWHELVYGVRRLPDSTRRRTLQDYLDRLAQTDLRLLPYDRRAAEWHATERARLEGQGNTPPFVDGQIAAIAVVNDLTLVTHNVKDFERFADLRVVDWLDSD